MADAPPVKLEHLIEYIRAFMRDYPELNRLVAGKEHSDRLIAMAIFDTVDEVRAMPPPIGVDINTIPISILRRGAVIFLLESLGLLMTRNQLNYKTGRGTGIGLQDKTPLLMNWLQMFKGEYKNDAKEWKISRNITEALRGSYLYSEYSVLNGLYGNWGL